MTSPTVPVARTIKWDLYLTLTLTIVNIIGGTTFWLSLPEKLKLTKEELQDHETRLRALEKTQADIVGIVSRIDERTKAIQENVSQLRADFSFRAAVKP